MHFANRRRAISCTAIFRDLIIKRRWLWHCPLLTGIWNCVSDGRCVFGNGWQCCRQRPCVSMTARQVVVIMTENRCALTVDAVVAVLWIWRRKKRCWRYSETACYRALAEILSIRRFFPCCEALSIQLLHYRICRWGDHQKPIRLAYSAFGASKCALCYWPEECRLKMWKFAQKSGSLLPVGMIDIKWCQFIDKV